MHWDVAPIAGLERRAQKINVPPIERLPTVTAQTITGSLATSCCIILTDCSVFVDALRRRYIGRSDEEMRTGRPAS